MQRDKNIYYMTCCNKIHFSGTTNNTINTDFVQDPVVKISNSSTSLSAHVFNICLIFVFFLNGVFWYYTSSKAPALYII